MEYNSSLHIRTKAVQLLQDNNIDPYFEIDIKSLISVLQYNISYRYADLQGLAGFTCHDTKKTRFRMYLDINTYDNCPARINFTMAHELGHIVLNHFDSVSSSIFIGNPFLESEANLFADELLMPTQQIVRYQMDACEIASTYKVSITAANNKIKYLKKNALYQESKDQTNVYKILSRCVNTFSYSRTADENMVNALRDNWLDPDYEF